MTCLNIPENLRFKKGGCKFLGTVPIYNTAAGIGSNEARSKRGLQVFHSCMDILSTELREFCMESCTLSDGGGKLFEVVPRVAFLSADYQQIQAHLLHVGSGCYMCDCPHSEMDRTSPANGDQEWPLRNFRKVLSEMSRLSEQVLSPDGTVKYGEHKTIEAWERQWKMCFMLCWFAKLLDVDFDALLGCPRDLLHHILLGIFGEHIVNAIVHAIKKALGHEKYWTAPPAPAGTARKPPALMNDSKMCAIFSRLAERLGMTNQDWAGFTISPNMGKHFLKVCLCHCNKIL